MNHRVFLLTSLLLSVLISCSSQISRASLEHTDQVTHIVVCWLKTPGNAHHRRELIEVSKSFHDLPGVVRVNAGEVLPSQRKVVVSDFDVAIVFTFENEAALRRYETHPRHQEALRKTLRPLTKKVIVYDFTEN